MSDMADRRQWHLDKSVSVAHIITTVALVVSALWFLAGQDRRISNLELNYAHLKAARVEDQERAERKFDELKTDLRMINAKLDRLIEGSGGVR